MFLKDLFKCFIYLFFSYILRAKREKMAPSSGNEELELLPLFDIWILEFVIMRRVVQRWGQNDNTVKDCACINRHPLFLNKYTHAVRFL